MNEVWAIVFICGVFALRIGFYLRRHHHKIGIGHPVHRAKRRPGPALHYEDMTEEQRREYGFRKIKDAPPEWRDFMRKDGSGGFR